MLVSLILVGGVAFVQVDAPADSEPELHVRRLVRQLDAPQLAERDAAEEKLIELGPDILDLLPEKPEQISAEVAQRVRRIRQKLQRVLAESAGGPSRVTLQGNLPLSEILAAIQKQTGNQIEYPRPGDQAPDPKLDVNFQKTPFWQALDQVLDQAGLGAYAFGDQKAVQVVPRPGPDVSRAGRACYSGPFRFEPVMIQATRDLRNPANQSLRLAVEVSWEPRLAPVSLQHRMEDVKAVDENENRLELGMPEAVWEVPVVPDSIAEQLEIPFVLPPRGVKKIARLGGTLTALLPSKVETFRFKDLPKAEKVEKRFAGVTVVFEQARQVGRLWEVRIRVRFDEASGALESHRTWIYENEAYLEDPDGKPVRPFTSDPFLQNEDEVGMAYGFGVERPLSDYTFVYKTPGLILTTKRQYEIRDIELP